jgi:hypothetical protein
MATPAEIRRQLFGAPRPRAPKPYDHLSKAKLWAEAERLRAQLRGAHRMATVAADSIDTLGAEGTPAYRQLSGARQMLREVCALTEEKRGSHA